MNTIQPVKQKKQIRVCLFYGTLLQHYYSSSYADYSRSHFTALLGSFPQCDSHTHCSMNIFITSDWVKSV